MWVSMWVGRWVVKGIDKRADSRLINSRVGWCAGNRQVSR
jgi:hypothetical protein